MSAFSKPGTRRNIVGVLSLAALLSASAASVAAFDRSESATLVAANSATRAAKPAVAAGRGSSATANQQIEAMRKLYQQQQNVAAISNMMRMQHMTNMSVINNIGSSNTRYEYKYVRRP